MEKFLNITGTAVTAYAGTQLVSCNGIKTITCTTATGVDCLIEYHDGTTTTVKTAATAAFDVQIALQDAVTAALKTSWTNPVYDATVPKAIVSIINA
tara:strand:- start:680 stop:970 length:291 start_codon:yes stop_codon:yes gene_type:complete